MNNKTTVLEMVRQTIRTCRMLLPGEPVLCALSGGADSTALLRILQALGYPVQAYHLNHCLRGAESDRDETFCRDLCHQIAVPLTVERADIRTAAKQAGESIETAARRIRYERLAAIAQGQKIATAHTTDDNMETVLFHLARGTGPAGLAGIPPVRGRIIRPLIQIERYQIEAYLASLGQGYVTDSTNSSNLYTRNRIRHEIIPVLRRMNPHAAEAVSRASALLRQDEAYLTLQAEQLEQSIRRPDGSFLVPPLRDAPAAVRSRTLRRLAIQAGMPPRDFSMLHVQALTRWLETDNPSALCRLPHGFTARRIYQSGCILREKKEAGPPEYPCLPLPVPFDGVLWDGATRLTVRRLEKNMDFNKSFNTFCVDCGTIDFETLCVRTRRIGDRIRLTARGGSRTLKKLMIDRHIPCMRRGTLAVIADQTGVIAVQDIGMDVSRRPADDGWTNNGQMEIKIRQTEG